VHYIQTVIRGHNHTQTTIFKISTDIVDVS